MNDNIQIRICAILGLLISLLFLMAYYVTRMVEPLQAAGIIAAFTLVIFSVMEWDI